LLVLCISQLHGLITGAVTARYSFFYFKKFHCIRILKINFHKISLIISNIKIPTNFNKKILPFCQTQKNQVPSKNHSNFFFIFIYKILISQIAHSSATKSYQPLIHLSATTTHHSVIITVLDLCPNDCLNFACNNRRVCFVCLSASPVRCQLYNLFSHSPHI
jgi:hypothetical protein